MFAATLLALVAFADQPMKKDEPQKLAPAKDVVYDIAGYYSCVGTDANGKKYNGICTIHQAEKVYIVTWVVGPASFTGVGMQVRHGNKSTLAVGWSFVKDGQLARGLNYYEISKDGDRFKLSGQWCAMPSSGTIHRETLTFLKEIEYDD